MFDDHCNDGSSNTCIHPSLVSDGVVDCPGGLDESLDCAIVGEDIDDRCSTRIYKCMNKEDSDKLQAVNRDKQITCQLVNKFVCNNQNLCEQHYYMCVFRFCSDMEMISDYSSLSSHLAFECEDGIFHSFSIFCDGRWTCNKNTSENDFGFKCKYLNKPHAECVMPQVNLNDDISHCEDRSDICYGTDGSFNCFQCLDKKLIISKKQLCDGKINCYDFSDECLCENQTVCSSLKSSVECRDGQILCDNKCELITSVICNFDIKCVDDVNIKFCSRAGINQFQTCKSRNGDNILSAKCDGRPECGNFEDECNSSCNKKPSYCGCPPLSTRFCDGRRDFNANPHNFCGDRELPEDCTARFYCTSGDMVSIDKELTCNGIHDCDKGEDENRTLCEGKLFYCKNGESAIRIAYTDDNVWDCSDGSDEASRIFATKKDLIGSFALRSIFWVMAVEAIIGNSFVIFSNCKYLVTVQSRTRCVQKGQKIMMLSLGVSDFLMGVYLSAISIKTIQLSGSYFEIDLIWRSSLTCTLLGSIASLSFQSSIFNVFILTFHRVIGLYYPFASEKIKIKNITLCCLASWFISLLLTIFPLFCNTFFTLSIYYPNLFRRSFEIPKNKFIELAQYSAAYDTQLKKPTNLKDSIALLERLFPNYPVISTFGYYSESSVCLPRLYAIYGSPAWIYTLCISTFNLILFILIATAYVLIYRKATKVKSVSSHETALMQKKSFRIVLSNFITWVPISFISYIRLIGIQLPQVYEFTGGLLMPINSVINPVLYSSISDILLKSFCVKRLIKLRKNNSQSDKDQFCLNQGFKLKESSSSSKQLKNKGSKNQQKKYFLGKKSSSDVKL